MEASGQGPLRGCQQSVELQQLLHDIFNNVLSDYIKLSLPDVSGQADRESADQRKYRLLQHLHGTRQQLLRALALLNWKPWKVLNELVDHDRVLDIAASHVRTLTEVVQQMRQQAAGRIMAGSYLNMYDVNTALEALTTGTYQELPSIILQRPPLFQPPPASSARQRSRLAHVTHLIRARLVQVALPPGLKVVGVSNGTAVLQAEGLYEAKLTLVPAEPLPGLDPTDAAAGAATAAGAAAVGGGEAGGSGGGPGYDWTAAGAAAAAADPVAAAAAAQRWKWRLIHFVLAIGVPFYDPRQPGQILNTCNFHMVLAADNATYLRRQRQTDGAAAAAGGGPAASTLSEAATPATSGLQPPGGGAAAAGGGGSLAAALRRVEDDEVGAPLAVMHAILTDVAGRLLADELAAAARALAAPGSRWHGHISVKPSQLLSPGVRIEYWTQAPPLLSQRALPAPGPGEDWRSVKPGPPYLELGMGEGGCVEVLHSPSSLHKPVSVSKLRLDTFRVNVEEVLMRAANMSSQFQLLQIRQELKANLVDAMGKRAPNMRLTSIARQLWCRDGHALAHAAGSEDDDAQPADAQQQQHQQVGAQQTGPDGEPGALSSAGGAAGSAAPMDVDSTPAAPPPRQRPQQQQQQQPIPPPTAPPPEVSGLLAQAAPEEEVAGALVVLSAPVLEYLVSGTTELKIGKHLFSGRLTLRPGQDERDEGSLDHAATIAMNEDHVNQAAMSAYHTASADSYPAFRALKEACTALSHLLQRTHTSTDATHFIQAARRASLHISRLPHGLLEAFTATTPGLAIEPRPREKVAIWALQCVPFPPNFPPLEPVPADTLPLRVPQCLTFFLQSRLSLASPHVLVVCSCNKQLMPIKVLSCIPVPQSTYRLPEQVLAAYMAVSNGGNHHHGSGHGGGSNGAAHGSNALHSTPHSGPNSPRIAGNGHEAGGHSPEASPRRDSTGGAGTGALQVRPSTGGGAASGGPSGPGPGSDVAGGGGAAGQTSGIPSLPSGSSPPLSHSYSYSQGRVQSSGAAASVSNPLRGGGGGGRPTGQQVAVMLAQQQLSSVVRWCRQRMVWEVLLVQLRAVGASFVELSNPPCQRVRVTAVAGTPLPCHIARRRGLTPARVGPVCLELELGPDVLAGQVTARLYGSFLCAPACAPIDRSGGGAAAAARRSFFTAATAGFVVDDCSHHGMPAARRACAGGVGSGSGSGGEPGVVCLRRQYCLERGESALTVVQEVAAVIRMQTLLARLEMTARPAAMAGGRAVQAQRLAVLTPPQPSSPSSSAPGAGAGFGAADGQGQPSQPWSQQQPQAGVTCSYRLGGGEVAAACGQPPNVYGGGGYHSEQPAAKRIKTDPGGAQTGPVDGYVNGGSGTWQQQQQQHVQQQSGAGYGNPSGLTNGVADGHGVRPAQLRGGGGNGAAAAATGPPTGPPTGLTWHWPLVGTLSLEEYSCSGATLRVTPCTSGPRQSAAAAAADAAGGAAPAAAATMPPPPLLLHITWAPRDVRDAVVGGGGGAAAAAAATPGAAASPALTPGGVIALPPPPSSQPSPAPSGVAPSPLAVAPSPAPYAAALLPQDMTAARIARPAPPRPAEKPFGSMFSDLVLATVGCSSGHSLPQDFLQSLEDLAEAGEEGKLLDAAVVAAWPVAGFCAALRPAVLSRHGLLPDTDVRLTTQQPPYCLRIVCRRRGPGGAGSNVLIDLICQAVGRSYLRVSAPLPSGTSAAQQAQGVDAAVGGGLERQSMTGGSLSASIKAESGSVGAGGPEGPSQAVLQAVQQLAAARLGERVHVSVGGRAAVYTGLGHRPAAVPGPGAPLWLLVPQDCVQQAVELVFSALG
ncbi:Mediator of RNA polymerase II transcription subunit 14 [Pleodorina starrii]|uniref:Mediator of RNA polymerase II transcription subunit 14 n=1 Tax=Pleodorina starrii TaxID=330485 RepID=A0A9W6F0D3_9CHLO|nr:Mediator of RNA polymerase II transcription subunit 14 [Pleodorina starrii]